MLRDESYQSASSEAAAARRVLNDDDGYQSVNAGQERDVDGGMYDSALDHQIPSENSDYDSPNKYGYGDREYRDYRRDGRREELINRAKRIAGNRVARKVGVAAGDENMFSDSTDAGRELAKAKARKLARKKASEAISKNVENKALRTGMRKGLSKEAGAAAKQGAKQLAKSATKAATQTAAKGAGEAAAAGLEGAVAAAGAATGVETFGLGFLIAILLNIAISLGVNDAVEALFELKNGNFEHALFLAQRAAAKVGMFVAMLVSLVLIFSVAGLIIAIPILLSLNLYMLAGMAFKKIGLLQGFVWWEKGILIFLDVMAFIFVLTFLAGMGWYLCTTTGLGSGGVTGAVTGFIASAYDWWNNSTAGSVAADFCKFVNTTAAGQ